jgi:hypothetical protein
VNRVHPRNLWLAWADSGDDWCARCAERYLFSSFPKAIKERQRGDRSTQQDHAPAVFEALRNYRRWTPPLRRPGLNENLPDLSA